MRAIKGKNNILSFISMEETRLFNKAEMVGFLNISNLTERENLVADGLYKKNVFRKVQRNEHVGYKIYPQREKL